MEKNNKMRFYWFPLCFALCFTAGLLAGYLSPVDAIDYTDPAAHADAFEMALEVSLRRTAADYYHSEFSEILVTDPALLQTIRRDFSAVMQGAKPIRGGQYPLPLGRLDAVSVRYPFMPGEYVSIQSEADGTGQNDAGSTNYVCLPGYVYYRFANQTVFSQFEALWETLSYPEEPNNKAAFLRGSGEE